MRAAPFGVVPRPRRFGVAASVVVTLLAHALLLAALTRAGPPARKVQVGAAPAATVRLWLVSRAAAPGGAPASPGPRPGGVTGPAHAAAATGMPAAPMPAAGMLAAAVFAPAAPEPATPTAALTFEPPEAAPVAPEPISGTVFALPTIGMGGASGTSRWRANAVAATAASPPAPRAAAVPPPEDALREHARTQLVRELLQHLSTLAKPPDSGPGRCEPDDGTSAPALRCDSVPLQQAFADGGAALAALLTSYRTLDPRVRTTALAWHEGQFHLDLR